MAAPVLTFVKLVDDTPNIGKQMQTQSESVGGQTVHAHYVIPRTKRKLTGIYNFVMGLQSVSATAQDGISTTQGFFWYQVPAAAAIRGRLRHLSLDFSTTTEVDHLTVPRVVLARATFTGTPSAGPVVVAKRITADAAMVSDIRTNMTGMTVTLGGLAWTAIAPSYTVTTSGIAWGVSAPQEFKPTDEEEFLDIGPSEALVLYQPDAGTTTDGRRFTVKGRIDEYDAA